MKKLLTLLSVFATLFALAPMQAEARGHCNTGTTVYVSGRTSCGCPIYTKKVFRYYDCHGYPVYAYYRLPVKHTCQHRNNHYRPSNSCNLITVTITTEVITTETTTIEIITTPTEGAAVIDTIEVETELRSATPIVGKGQITQN